MSDFFYFGVVFKIYDVQKYGRSEGQSCSKHSSDPERERLPSESDPTQTFRKNRIKTSNLSGGRPCEIHSAEATDVISWKNPAPSPRTPKLIWEQHVTPGLTSTCYDCVIVSWPLWSFTIITPAELAQFTNQNAAGSTCPCSTGPPDNRD